MKKYICLILLVFITVSCTEDIKFNNPAFQALKDNVFWRGQNYKAYLGTNGNVTIEGALGFEKIVLQTASSAEQTHILGVDEASKASYSNTFPEQASFFSTGTNKGSGQIVITDFDAENKTISGTFKFNAPNLDENSTASLSINFTEGVFYKVPLTDVPGASE
jgi:hypothetical protein